MNRKVSKARPPLYNVAGFSARRDWSFAFSVIRTLTGHKSEVKCLDVHPYGDFVASGSLDTNIKVWDVRRKGCIFTYRVFASLGNVIVIIVISLFPLRDTRTV